MLAAPKARILLLARRLGLWSTSWPRTHLWSRRSRQSRSRSTSPPIGKDERNCGSGATCRTSSRPWERGSWVGAGLLSTLYHVFEAPVVYPAFLGGLGLAGLWALRRNLWPCLLLHALFTASG